LYSTKEKADNNVKEATDKKAKPKYTMEKIGVNDEKRVTN